MTNKEWRYIITIIVLIEAFIAYISFIYAGNASALGYVSFAGTITSIILAVLAIGYTYGESVKQKNSSDTVVDQITKLNEVIKNIQLESESLNQISTINEELLQLSKNFKEGTDNTHNKVDSVNQTLNKILSESERIPQKNAEIQNTFDKTSLSQLLTKERNGIMDISLLTIYLTDKKSLPSSLLIKNIVNDYTNKAEFTETEYNNKSVLANLFLGAAISTYSICKGLGLLTIKDDKIELDANLKEVIMSIVDSPTLAGSTYAKIRVNIINEIKAK